MEYTPSFLTLVSIYTHTQVEFSDLKPVTLAMWILESARGTSQLASEHRNYAGMKWRTEMKPFGKRVNYEAHDGDGYYTEFNSLEDFVRGFWAFLDRSPYDGWRDRAADPAAFIRFVGPIWAEDEAYADKVLGLAEEARGLLSAAGAVTSDAGLEDGPFTGGGLGESGGHTTLVSGGGLGVSGDGKRLTPSGGLTVDYRGDDTCPYGVAATRDREAFKAIILHHNSPVHDTDWYVQYQIDGDPGRNGHHFGYHIYVAPDGRIIQGAPMTVRTNHVSNWSDVRRSLGRFANNTNAIGITCSEAGVVSGERTVGSRPTQAQNESVYALVWLLCDLYGIPFAHVWGHGEIQTTRHRSEGSAQAQEIRGWQG